LVTTARYTTIGGFIGAWVVEFPGLVDFLSLVRS